jgi:rhamnosyltransferase
MYTLTLVIRTKNEEKYIDQCLNSVAIQSYPVNEIIIVDSGSEDNTLDKISRFKNIKLIEIKPEEFSFGGALNRCIKEASSDLIISLSGHVILESPDYIQNIVKWYEKYPNLCGVYTRQEPHPEANIFFHYEASEDALFSGKEIMFYYEDSCFSNVCSVFKKSAWEDIRFDEACIGGEDIDWSRRAIEAKKGFILYDGTLKVYHSHHDDTYASMKRRSIFDFEAQSTLSEQNYKKLSTREMIYFLKATVKKYFYRGMKFYIKNFFQFKNRDFITYVKYSFYRMRIDSCLRNMKR